MLRSLVGSEMCIRDRGYCLVCSHTPIEALGFCKHCYNFLKIFFPGPLRRPKSVRSVREVVLWELAQCTKIDGCLIVRETLTKTMRVTFYNEAGVLSAASLRSLVLLLNEPWLLARQRGFRIYTTCRNRRCMNYHHFKASSFGFPNPYRYSCLLYTSPSPRDS